MLRLWTYLLCDTARSILHLTSHLRSCLLEVVLTVLRRLSSRVVPTSTISVLGTASGALVLGGEGLGVGRNGAGGWLGLASKASFAGLEVVGVLGT